MKQKYLLWLAISAVIMILFPLAAVYLVKGDAGMAACYFLFFALNPLYFVIMGIGASYHMKQMWSLPLVTAVLFVASSWVIFTFGDVAFLLYALLYTIMSMVAMVVFRFLRKHML